MLDQRILEAAEILALGGPVSAIPFGKLKSVFGEYGNGYRYHPLGFFYSAIQVDDLRDLRFHVWPTTWSIPELQDGGELHDHNFGLTSAVIKGELCNENFDATEALNGRYNVLTVAYDGVGSKVKLSGTRVNLTLRDRSLQSEGSIYHVPAGTIHQTYPNQLPTATLVLAQKSENPSPPRVLSQNHLLANRSFNRTAISDKDEEQVSALIRML